MHDNTNTTTPGKATTYMGGMVYEQNQLQFMSHEEGRMRMRTEGTKTTYVNDYFVKDHLGNVRMVLTDEEEQNAYPAASLETASLAEEKRYYRIPDDAQVRVKRSDVPGYPDDRYPTPNDYVHRLNGLGTKLGSSIVLKVMSGDRVNIRATSWYRQNGVTPGTAQDITQDIVLSLAEGIVGASAGKLSLLQLQQPEVLRAGVAGFLLHKASNMQSASRPTAYVSWLLLDEQLRPVITGDGKNSGFEQVGADQEFKVHQITAREITKSGYLYIYVSNETPNINVFFDNLQVTHTKGPLLEETHYYPFGLTMTGISNKALKFGVPGNKTGFNSGNELQKEEFSDGSGSEWYDAINRMYDPQIGRFGQIDKLADVLFNYSPYLFGNNNPIIYNDPLGLLSTPDNPEVLEEVIVTAKKKNPWNNLSYASTAAWVDKQRSNGFNNNQINIFLSRQHLNNHSQDKFNDAMSQAATNIREAENEYKNVQAEIAEMIAFGMVPIATVGGLVGKIGGQIINTIAKSGGNILATVAVNEGTKALITTGVKISKHAAERMIERGITKRMVELGISKGTKYFDPKNGTINYVLRNGFGSGKDLLIGTNPLTNKVTTVIKGNNLIKTRHIPL